MKKHVSHKAGRFLMVGVSSYALTQEEKRFLNEVQPQGVIYFRRNVDSPNQLIDLTREIQSCLNHPAIIGIDQEGGRVARLGPPFTIFPDNEDLAKWAQKQKDWTWIVKKAQWLAKECGAIGINCNFAPVADILTYPENPIMKKRTFGSDPAFVSECVCKTIEQFTQNNIISCAKHFPGHGDTEVDSHLELPKVQTPEETLVSRELLPFVRAIACKVPMIMTAHIVYTQLDQKHPATLSEKIIEKLLKQTLGFKGLVVSDDLEMKAIEHHYDIDHASVMALKAGCHMVLVCEDQSKAYACYEKISACQDDPVIMKRQQEQSAIVSPWKKTFLQPKTLRKRKKWQWASHQFPQIN